MVFPIVGGNQSTGDFVTNSLRLNDDDSPSLSLDLSSPNTDITYAFGSGKVTGTYGTATAKAFADSTWTSQDKTDGLIPSDKDVGDVKVEGLKTIKKRVIDNQCAGLLAPSDWRVVKATETG